MEGFIFFAVVVAVIWILASRGRGLRSRKRSYSRNYRNSSRRNSQPFDDANSAQLSEAVVLQGYARIVDGDTIVIQKTQIRLFGVDAPELHHPYGQKAKWALVSLCKGQTVRAEISQFDDHGRSVAKCFLQDGRDLSAEMVKQGLAIDWPKFSDGKYRKLEVPNARKKLWLADARQKGRMHVWEQFEARQNFRNSKE